MSRAKSLLTAGLLGATLTFASLGGAAAGGLGPNENNGGGPQNDNCIAWASSVVIGNGHADTLGENAGGGARRDEMRMHRDHCGSTGFGQGVGN